MALIRASVVVGGIGVLAALPLLALLSALHPAAHRRGDVHLAVIIFIFAVATTAFAAGFRLLPASRYRSRFAGVVAALVTYTAVSVLYWLGVGEVRGQPFRLGPVVALVAFAVIGWLPTSAGFFAGWFVERSLPASPNNALERAREG